MSSLSQTILGGTSQISGAYQSALEQRNKNALIKRSAIAQLNESIGDLGKSWKEHRDWKAAKQAEDEVAQVYDAEVLARSQGALEHVPATLGALRLTSPEARRVRAKQASVAQGEHLAKLEYKLRRDKVDYEAGEAQIKAQTAERQRAAMATAVAKHGPEIADTEEGQVVIDNALAGNLSMDQWLRYVTQRRLDRKADADRAAKDAIEARKEEGRNKRFAADKEEDARQFGITQEGKAEDRGLRRRHIDAMMDADENNLAMSKWAKSLDATVRMQAINVARTRADFDATEFMLKSEMDALEEDEKTLANYRSMGSDDEKAMDRLATTIAGAKTTVKSLMRDLRIRRDLLREPGPDLPAAPESVAPASGGGADPVLSQIPENMRERYNSLPESEKAKVREKLGIR